ncbi:hypothetical protein HRbin36_01643 [bacterium HR36]|nr:hypothetical protein HRbin36_01643 [bacterium HR36]
MNVLVLCVYMGLNISIIADAEHWLEQAERLYSERRYCSACEISKWLRAQGFSSPDLEHNLGVSALACGDLGTAIYYLRRAACAQPFQREHTDALQAARRLVPHAPTPPRDTTILAFWANLIARISWVIGWCCFVAIHFRYGGKLGVVGLVFLMASLAAWGIATYATAQERKFPWAVVHHRCEVRAGNGESYPVALMEGKPLILIPGSEVQALGQRSNGWILLAIEGRAVGWAPRSCLYLSAEPILWR